MTRSRLRDLGITLGRWPTGSYNAITDVAEVLVGHTTLIYDEPRVARTGVTVILPRRGDIWLDNAPAAYHAFNGCGEMTGLAWIEESGALHSPIGITNTHQCGLVRDALGMYAQDHDYSHQFTLPVAAETYDGWLNDADAHHVTKEHVFAAINNAQSGVIAEGCVGGGTGMICHDFKGGIGTSSRVVENGSGRWTVGVLVQANHGDRDLFRVDGVPVGREINREVVPIPGEERRTPGVGSIIVVVATDAPLIPSQCKRLAQRATVGLARVGSVGHNGSGDIFIAFATGNHLPDHADQLIQLQMLPHHHMNELFEGTAEATEEAILNAVCMAETMTGYQGHMVHALPLDKLQEVMQKYGRTT
jgi:D-aminopeptidase